MKIKNKGFTLVETLLIIGVITLMTLAIYQQFSKKYNQYLVGKQAQYIEQILIGIKDQLNTVSDTDTVAGTAAITAAINPPTNLISANMIPNEMISSATTVKNLWDGAVTFSGQNIPLVIAGPIMPQYELTLTNIPANSCAQLAGHTRIVQAAQRIIVNGLIVKQGGNILADAAAISNSCVLAANTIQISASPFKAGVSGIVSTGSVAALRAKEAPYYIAPAGTTTITAGVPVCNGGTAWNAAVSACVCPAGNQWNGQNCVVFGTPGVCPLGQGWNLATSTCQALPSGVSYPGVYASGRYVPNNITTPSQITTTLVTACNGAVKPVSAVSATNPAGNFDGKFCQMCVLTGGSWNGDRCVAP